MKKKKKKKTVIHVPPPPPPPPGTEKACSFELWINPYLSNSCERRHKACLRTSRRDTEQKSGGVGVLASLAPRATTLIHQENVGVEDGLDTSRDR